MNKKGFLLVDLIVSLTAFSIMLLIFGYFFLYITTSYKYTHDQLNGMMYAQNGIEKSWLAQGPDVSDDDPNCPHKVALPLPDRGLDLPHTIVPLEYHGWSLSARQEEQATTIPGCVCEKK